MSKFYPVASKYKIVLGSGSPRRKAFLEELGLDFTIRKSDANEWIPDNLQPYEVAEFLAKEKASVLFHSLAIDELLITSDTVVWDGKCFLEKPIDKEDAMRMLRSLSNSSHKVISSLCLTTHSSQIVDHATSIVSFESLTEEEMLYYVETFSPFDKAGGYGIQEWIGLIGIKSIEGSYTNIVGLPTHLLHKMLKNFKA